MAFPKGLGKLGANLPDKTKGEQKSTPAGDVGGEKQTVITHHGDGTHSTQHADGSSEEHPDHLHMLASIGHKVTGGDKHHIVHHDGGTISSHGIDEGGEHHGTDQHGDVEDAKDSMGKFLGEEGDEVPDEEEPEEEEPSYGGLRR